MTANVKQHTPLPEPGDIVWCHFPQLPGKPGPKPRPALVLQVSEQDHEVRVVYGTSQKTQKIYPTEFLLKKGEPGFSLSGLARDTKFDMAVKVELPFNSDWFDLAPIKDGVASMSPVMGALHPTYLERVKQANRNADKSS